MPRIIQPAYASYITLIEGNILSLDCFTSGDPAPVITWILPDHTQRLASSTEAVGNV